MTKVLVITSWPTNVIEGSGTAVFFNTLTSGLRERGFDLEIIAPNFDITDYVAVTKKRFLFNRELRADPRIQDAQVLIGFDYDGYALDPMRRPPLISSAHAVYGDVIQWEKGEIKEMVRAQAERDHVAMAQAQSIIIGSQYAKDRVVTLYEIDAEKISVVPHGMVRAPWMHLFDALPRLPNDHPVILSVGKMYPRKRIELSLEAIARLLSQFPTLELRVIGEGITWDELHAKANQFGISKHITWLGHVTDDAAFAHEWRQADVFCHPSSQETFGFVYLEAMMVGVPIVAARAGAAPEVLGDAGILVDPDNSEALAEGIKILLTDSQRRQLNVFTGKARATNYSVNRMLDSYESIIKHVLSTYPY